MIKKLLKDHLPSFHKCLHQYYAQNFSLLDLLNLEFFETFLQQSIGYVVTLSFPFVVSAIQFFSHCTMIESKYVQNQAFSDIVVCDTLLDILHNCFSNKFIKYWIKRIMLILCNHAVTLL